MTFEIVKIVVDIVVAIGTLAMAGATAWMIVQNRRQHRDSLRPICVLMPQDGVDPLSREGFVQARPDASAKPWERVFAINCQLKNVGSGPAMNLRLSIRFMEREGYGPTREQSPLAAGETRGEPFIPMFIPVALNDGFNDSDYSMASGTGWEIVLEYQDVFGQVFHTIHKKNPLEPWTECGEGFPPRGLSREQMLSS